MSDQPPAAQATETETADAPPPPPVPSSDPRLSLAADAQTPEPAHHVPPQPSEKDGGATKNLFELPSADALKMLSAGVELLVLMTGDVPPTPPPKSPTVPHMSGMQAEKENIVRSHSGKNLARMRAQAEAEAQKAARKLADDSARAAAEQEKHAHTSSPTSAEPIDGVQLKPSATKPEPYIVVGADSQPVNLQHGAITRKFYSKNEPPISINQYLLRLHQFCPMSTAVYLATSLYIHRLAVVERAIPVTRRNAHRLVLAGLRVAMKALEDLSYPHTKMAKVGGVSEAELARLEISFCFLTGFELVVGEERLAQHWERLQSGTAHHGLDHGGEVPTLLPARKPQREQNTVAG